jgi:signal peptidase
MTLIGEKHSLPTDLLPPDLLAPDSVPVSGVDDTSSQTLAGPKARRLAGRATMVVLCACLLTMVVFLRPHRVLDGPVEFVVVAGHSMDPHFASGDLVIVKRASSYHIGNVIAFKVPAGPNGTGGRVIHRIVGGSASRGWITRGDNRTTNDPWRVHPADILGRQWLHVPFYRQITDVIPPQLLFASLAGIAALLLAWPRKLEDDNTDTDPREALAAP